MRPTEIEVWAHRVMDRVERGNGNEDVRVELKAAWPDLPEMVRRVAGHANAAGSDTILWLIGVDEKGHAIPGVVARDAATWYPSFKSCFDEIAPRMQDLIVHRGGKEVTALLFETDRSPYVVRNPAFGSAGVKIQNEVPWRDGTAIRTARREDLLRILVPQARLPEIELREVWSKDGGRDGQRFFSEVLVWFYIVPTALERIYVPFHRCRARLRTLPRPWAELESVGFRVDRGGMRGIHHPDRALRESQSIAASETELVVDGAGGAILHGFHSILRSDPTSELELDASVEFAKPLEIELTLHVARADAPLFLSAVLEPSSAVPFGAAARWVPKTFAQTAANDASETPAPTTPETA